MSTIKTAEHYWDSMYLYLFMSNAQCAWYTTHIYPSIFVYDDFEWMYKTQQPTLFERGSTPEAISIFYANR